MAATITMTTSQRKQFVRVVIVTIRTTGIMDDHHHSSGKGRRRAH
jgi:hypothetical protein